MNLNKYDREAFVKAVMADVPQADYQEQADQLVRAHFEKLTPPDVKKLLKSQPGWLHKACITTPRGLSNVYVYWPQAEYHIDVEYPDLWLALTELGNAKLQQNEQRETLESEVEVLIAGCRTLKQAQERLPEFIKYLPQERVTTGVGNLPAANTIAGLIQAGWPKGASNAA